MANELPCEVLCKIFGYLDSFEQLVACKKVCKKFYAVIASFFRLEELAITSYGHFPYSCRWFHSYNEVLGCQCEIQNSQFDLSNFQTNDVQFANLRQLFIVHECVETRFLNCLHQLQNLTIKSSGFRSGQVPLRLPRLQVLSIDECEIFDLVELHLPQLGRLKINLFKSYKRKLAFLHFDSVELLECSRYLKLTQKFSNLKIFYCERLCSSNVDDLFAHNLKLKEIHFNGPEETYAHLKQRKALLGRDHLKLYYSGKFGLHLDENTIECCVRNYSRLAGVMPFVKFVNFNCLENNFETIPKRMIKRFVNLFQLEVNGPIKDLRQFETLLHDCGYLNKLMVKIDDQIFFDLLPSICPVLKCLEISSREGLCLDFLLAFESLEAIVVSQEMPLTLVEQLFERIKTLRHLAFHYQDSFTEITYKGRRTVHLTIDPVKGVFFELDELLGFLRADVYRKDFSHCLNEKEMFVRSAFFLN